MQRRLADVTIAAPFFDPRLLIEGDTETGLLLKNLLDAIELPRWLRDR